MTREQRRQWRRYVFGCPDLTVVHRLVLLALADEFADFPAGTNARPGVAALAEICGCGERAVRYALERGCALRLIDQTDRANPKAGRAATYRLLPRPVSTGTTMPLETDFNRHETDFNRHMDDISTGTHVPPTNKDDQSITPKERGARAKGTYLPDDWSPTPEVVAQMRDEQPHINQELELEKFRDHWRSTTRNAMKRDWTAAYRNWIRNAAKWAPRNGSPDGTTAYERKKARNYAVYQSLADDPTPIDALPKELDQ
jgi:hypothetical protein